MLCTCSGIGCTKRPAGLTVHDALSLMRMDNNPAFFNSAKQPKRVRSGLARIARPYLSGRDRHA